jgi:hypothetical protein
MDIHGILDGRSVEKGTTITLDLSGAWLFALDQNQTLVVDFGSGDDLRIPYSVIISIDQPGQPKEMDDPGSGGDIKAIRRAVREAHQLLHFFPRRSRK